MVGRDSMGRPHTYIYIYTWLGVSLDARKSPCEGQERVLMLEKSI